MTILENQYINNSSWNYFQNKLKDLAEQPKWLDLLKSVKMKCDIFGLTNKWEEKVSDIEDELKQQMKVHLAFYNNTTEEIENTFNKLPLFIQYLILVYFQYYTSKIIEFNNEEKKQFLQDISNQKTNIAKKLYHFCKGYRDTPIPIKKLSILLDLDCFDITKKKDKFILDFFNVYFTNKEVEAQMLEEFDEDYFKYLKERFYSSKPFLDLYNMSKEGKVTTFVTPDLFFNKTQTKQEQPTDNKETEPVKEQKLIIG